MWPANFSKRTCICSLICLALLAGCATPQGKFHSRKDPAYGGKLGRVLIIYHNEEDAVSQVGRKFADAFLTRFTALLGQKDVVTVAQILLRMHGEALLKEENIEIKN